MGVIHKIYRDEKQIETSNIQIHIKIITLLVLKQNSFKVNINLKYYDSGTDANVNVTDNNDNFIFLGVLMTTIGKQQTSRSYNKINSHCVNQFAFI